MNISSLCIVSYLFLFDWLSNWHPKAIIKSCKNLEILKCFKSIQIFFVSSLDQVLRQHTCDLSQSHVVASHSNTYWQLDHCQIIGLPGVISGVWVICVCRSLLQLWHWWLYCNINVPFHNKWPQLYLKFKYSHNFPIVKGISINLNWEFHLDKMF